MKDERLLKLQFLFIVLIIFSLAGCKTARHPTKIKDQTLFVNSYSIEQLILNLQNYSKDISLSPEKENNIIELFLKEGLDSPVISKEINKLAQEADKITEINGDNATTRKIKLIEYFNLQIKLFERIENSILINHIKENILDDNKTLISKLSNNSYLENLSFPKLYSYSFLLNLHILEFKKALNNSLFKTLKDIDLFIVTWGSIYAKSELFFYLSEQSLETSDNYKQVVESSLINLGTLVSNIDISVSMRKIDAQKIPSELYKKHLAYNNYVKALSNYYLNDGTRINHEGSQAEIQNTIKEMKKTLNEIIYFKIGEE